MLTSSLRRLAICLAAWALPFVAAAASAGAASPAPQAAAPVVLAGGAPLSVPAQGRRKAPEFARIASRGEIVVAMLNTDSPPFFYERDHRLTGIDVEMALEIGRDLGVKVRFDRGAGSFNEVVDKVSRGEADLGISKISRTLARSQAVLFSDPYLTLHHAVILNRLAFAKVAGERTPGEAMRDFGGSLGVIAKSSFADFAASNFPRAKVRQYPGWHEVVDAVQRGEVVGGYRDEFEVKRLLAERPTAALTLRTVTLKDRDDTIGVAVGADAPVLLAYVNLFLATRKTKLDIGDVLKALPAPEATAP